MATVNLLTASFDGKLGETYGAKWKSTHTIKAIPFSHAPHGEKATNAVRAFEKLNLNSVLLQNKAERARGERPEHHRF